MKQTINNESVQKYEGIVKNYYSVHTLNVQLQGVLLTPYKVIGLKVFVMGVFAENDQQKVFLYQRSRV